MEHFDTFAIHNPEYDAVKFAVIDALTKKELDRLSLLEVIYYLLCAVDYAMSSSYLSTAGDIQKRISNGGS